MKQANVDIVGEPVRELIAFGLKDPEELFEQLSNHPGIVAQVISSVDASERFSHRFVPSGSKDHVVLEGGVEPVLSFLRFYRSSTILSCAFFATCPGIHVADQILKMVNFGIFDSSLSRLEAANHPCVMDLQWLTGYRTRECVRRMMEQVLQPKSIEISGNFESGEVMLNVCWFLAKYASPFSIERRDDDGVCVRSLIGPIQVKTSLIESYRIISAQSERVLVVNDAVISGSDGVEEVKVKYSVWDLILLAMNSPHLFKDYNRSWSLLKYLLDK